MLTDTDYPIDFKKAGEALKLPFFLEEILIEVKKKIGCEAGSILMFNEKTERLEFKVIEGGKSTEIKKLSVDPHEGIAGWVFQKGEPLVVNNTEGDKRFCVKFDKSTGYATKSILAVPLKVGDKVVGIFELLNKTSGRFSQEDIGVVLSYASIASVVIENIELYRNLRVLEKKVRNLEGYQKVLLESLTDGVISIDSNNHIVSCNSSFLKIVSLSRKEIIGKNVSALVGSEDTIKNITKGCRKNGKARDLFCYLRGNEKRGIPVAIDAAVLQTDGDSKGLVIVVKNMKSALNQEEIKREVILSSDLVTNLSHELNTPLTAIQAGIQLLKQDSNGNGKYVDIVYNNVEILKSRIRIFLDYLKAEKDEWDVHFRRIQLNDYLKRIINEFRERFSEHRFRLSLPNSKIYIDADEQHLTKVLIEIVKNAIQYSKSGSRIRIKVIDDSNFVHLSIADQGNGILPENIEFLFQRFRRFSDSLKETSSGLGIGLWLAKYLLEKNNARITIKSKEGKGTIVRISFTKQKETACL